MIEETRRNRDLQALSPISVYEADILDVEALRPAFDKCQPDAVVHLAAWAGVRPFIEKPALYAAVNVTGTVNVLELAREYATKCFIFGSSSSVYGGNEKTPFSESDPVDRPESPYAATKRAGELLCNTYSHNFSMNIACLRYLPNQSGDMLIAYADIQQARQLLGYDPKTQIALGIDRFAAWFRGSR